MKDHWKISTYQFGLLVTLFTLGSSILLIPSGLAAESKQDAWISAVLGTSFSLLLVWIYAKIGNYFPGRCIIEIFQILFGKPLGKIISLLFVIFAFLSFASLLWITGSFLSIHILMGTPIVVINALFVGVLIFGVRLGIETIARSAEIVFPWIFVFFTILITFNAPNMDFINILPVLQSGTHPILKGALIYLSVTTLPQVVLLTISPKYLTTPKNSTLIFCLGTLLGGLMLVGLTMTSIFVLGVEHTAMNHYPSYTLAREINLGIVFERTEAILTGLWINAIFYKAILYFFGAVIGLAQTLELKDYKPITLPLGMIALATSLIIYPDTVYASKWDTTTWISYSLSFGLFLPLLLFILGFIRKK